MGQIQAVLFDFDGTIVDFIKADTAGLRRVYRLLPAKIEWDSFVKASVDEVMEFHRLFGEGSVIPQNVHRHRLSGSLRRFGIEWHDRYESAYLRGYLNATAVFPEAKKVIRRLRGRVRLGLLTNDYRPKDQRRRIANTGMARFFDEIVVCSEIGHYKPSREAFLYMVKEFALEASSCLYVGDSEEYDVRGARNAGLPCIRICHQGADMVQSEADEICSGFRELQSVLSERYGL